MGYTDAEGCKIMEEHRLDPIMNEQDSALELMELGIPIDQIRECIHKMLAWKSNTTGDNSDLK